jgi:hypothetical protein
MKFTEFKTISEAQFNSKQEVIDHFVKQGKSAAAGASAWERGWRGHTPKKKELKPPVRSYHDDLDDKRYGETNEDNDPCWDGYKRKPGTEKYAPGSCEKIEEAALGTAPKRPARSGSRPDRGHNPVNRYKKVDYCDACDRPKAECICDDEKLDEHKKGVRAHKYTKKPKGTIETSKKYMNSPAHKTIGPKEIAKLEKALHEAEQSTCQYCGCSDHTSLDESGKASRSLCTSSKPDADLGASQLASCKSQGLRARDGKKSHKIGKTRVTMGGHKIKGRKYGGPVPDWS